MGVVHHANYVRYFELSRVKWLAEHDRPYREYVEQGIHFAVTRVEADYQQPARFDDELQITAWLAWVRHASLGIAYEIIRDDQTLVVGATEHAAVDAESGRPRRMPRERRAEMLGLVPPA
jgi:acyl-CoA thioester hydrolase